MVLFPPFNKLLQARRNRIAPQARLSQWKRPGRMRKLRGIASITILSGMIAIALVLPVPPAYSSGNAPEGCSIQYALLRMRLKLNAFVTSRTLGEYGIYSAREFKSFLETLGPGSHWLDAGAGKGHAIAQYVERNPAGARVTGVVYSGKRPKNAPDQLRYLSGRYIEDIPDEELGRADLITDLFGPGSYSTRISEVLNKYLRILTPGGRAFVTLTSEATVTVNGRSTTLLGYLLSLSPPPGIEITHEGSTLIIRKAAETGFQIPTLELTRVESGAPPYRWFRPRD